MEIVQSSKKMGENLKKMSLKGYYKSLPERIAPKQMLVDDIQDECERMTGSRPTMASVKNWILYDMKPKNPLHVKAIAKVTGIKEEYLWQD